MVASFRISAEADVPDLAADQRDIARLRAGMRWQQAIWRWSRYPRNVDRNNRLSGCAGPGYRRNGTLQTTETMLQF
jgi:hypothetical protein